MNGETVPRTRVYRRADLERVLHPRSIAIVGASARIGSFGERVLNNLVGYEGRVHLVNPKVDRLGERIVHPNLSALPESPDCVVVCVPREAAEEVVARSGAGQGRRRAALCFGLRRDGQTGPHRPAAATVADRGGVGPSRDRAELSRPRQLCARHADYFFGISGSKAVAHGIGRYRQPVRRVVAVACAIDRNRHFGEPFVLGGQPGGRRRGGPRRLPGRG